jgi:hypothetical protein
LLNRCRSDGQKCIGGAFDHATVSLAYAQTTDSKACTEQERGNQTLSEKLGQTNGVICPPDIDKGMKAPTPDAGKTPVIRRLAARVAIRTSNRNKLPPMPG